MANLLLSNCYPDQERLKGILNWASPVISCHQMVMSHRESWTYVDQEIHQDHNQEFISNKLYEEEKEDDILNAKEKELSCWKD